MGFQDILMSIDLLGFPPYFTFKDKKAYKSSFGAILSILAFLVSIVSVYSNFEAWLYQINPIIQRETLKNENNIPLATMSNKVLVMLSQVKLTDFSKSKVLNYPELGELAPSIVYANITGAGAQIEQNIKLSRCDKDYISDMDTDISDKAFCLPPELSYYIF